MRCLQILPLLFPVAAFAQAEITSQTPHVQAELENTIKVKKAKPGDKVKAKTISPLTLPNGTVIPVASEIYGHVTEATNGEDGSSVAIAFDQLEIKNRKTPVTFSIRAAMGSADIANDGAGGTRPGDAAPAPMHGGGRNIGQTSAAPAPQRGLSHESVTQSGGELGAQAGSVLGMPGVSLQVDDGPQHASKFVSKSKDLQLSEGLQLMLAVVQ